MNMVTSNDVAFRSSAEEETTELSSNEVNELMNSHLNESDDFFGDEFDPDELLNSPLFNEPRSKFMNGTESYDDFAEDDDENDEGEEPDKSPPIFNAIPSSGFDNFTNSNALESNVGFMTQPTPPSPKRSVSGPSSFLPLYQNMSPSKVLQNETNFNMMQQQHQNQQQFPNQQQIQNDQGFQQHFQNQQQLQNQLQQQSQQLEQQQVSQSYSSPIKYSSPRRPLNQTPLRSVSYHGTQSPAVMNNSFRSLRQTPPQITPGVLSQSLHGVPFNGDNNSSFQDSLNTSMNGDSSMRGQQMNSNFTSPPFNNFGNVSIATQIQSPKSNIQNFNHTSMGSQQDQSSASLNNAMEKLCDSMKRSAMTRSIVKQISGRNLVKQTSSRGLLLRQNSGLQRSSRSLMDENSGRSVSIRRMPNAKHHLQHSQHSLNGHSNHGGSVNLQIDGRNMGAF